MPIFQFRKCKNKTAANAVEAVQWLNRKIICPPGPLWFVEYEEKGIIQLAGDALLVQHPEGEKRASPGDWIVKIFAGVHVYKPDDFAAIFEPAVSGEW